MKLMKILKKPLVLLIVTVCLGCLFSCKTTESAAKTKKGASGSSKMEDEKTATYRAVAQAVTQQCPIKVDEDTTLTGLEYNEDQYALVYTYLFTGGVYEDMNEQGWAVVQGTVREMLKEGLKTNNLLSKIREHQLNMVYIFKDKNNKELFTVTLHPGEY